MFRFSDTQWHYGTIVCRCVFYMDPELWAMGKMRVAECGKLPTGNMQNTDMEWFHILPQSIFSKATSKDGPYKTHNGEQRHNGADVHQNLPKNYLKLSNNCGLGLGLGLGIELRLGLVFRFSDTQWHYGIDVHRNLPKTTENLVIIRV